jgi:aryl sulfotransferase
VARIREECPLKRLNITVPDDRFSELVAAARFDAMRERADELVPDSTHAIWQDNKQFFHTGRNGQWQTLLDAEGQRRYATHVTTLAPYDVVVWAHGGPLDPSMRD